MMATPKQDAMEKIEERRAQLEENVSKLREALKHWQTWEYEYEMLKEEIQSANSPSTSQMMEIGRDLHGSLVNEKEVQELLGKKNQPKRNANQVIDMISRRVDYVQQNISTVEKQLDAAEKKLAGASVLLEPDMENEEGLPLMDIQEELDEDGNVLSSSVLQPGKSAPDIVEALQKAGIQKAEQGKVRDSQAAKKESSGLDQAMPANGNAGTKATSAPPAVTPSTSTHSRPTKKSVSFAEDLTPDAKPDAKPDLKPDQTTKKLSPLQATGYNEELADYNFTKGTKVIEVDEYDNEIASYPIIPQGESPEETALRRQMLQYGLSEVGQIVAEIDLDGRDDGSDDDEYDDEYDSEEDEDEDEDQYGRSTRREVTADYRKQMLELEEKLNARMLENVGPRPDTHPLAEYSDDLRKLRIQKDETLDQPDDVVEDSNEAAKPQKKGVRFADDLDIASVPEPIRGQTPNVQQTISTPTISDTIVERSGTATQSQASGPTKTAKVSRFKSSRPSSTTQPVFNTLPPRPVPEPQPVPQGPQGRTLANTIVEHDRPSDPQAPDEFDPTVINREVQTQYHKMRNKMIQQQGGFNKSEEEEEEGPLLEERDGKTRKVSRFRAARLKGEDL